MQIRLTVLGHGDAERGGPAGVDLRVTAPENTPLAAVLGALAGAAAPGSAAPGAVFCEEERLDPRAALLGEPPLVDGAVLSFHRPVAGPGPEPVPARLLVVAGPDAGGVHLLRGGSVRIGRSADADVPLDDPDVSRMHCAVALEPDGSATVADLGSTNGTFLDGREVTGRVPLPPGGVLRLGETALRLVPGEPAARAGLPAPRRDLDRAPAPGGPAAAPPVLPPAPQDLPSASSAAPGDAAPAPARPAASRPGPSGPTVRRRGFATWARERLGGPGETREVPRWDAEAEAARARQDDARAEAAHPDLARVLLTALERGPRLWERTADHPEAFTVRLGTAHRASRALPPVAVSLREAGSLGLAGPRHRVAGLARAALAQLAALHGPGALELVVLAPGKAAEWSWLGWLPHTRPRRGQDCGLLLAFDAEQAAARTAELVARAGARAEAGQARTVVLVDGEPGGAETTAALARLAAEGPAAGIHVIALAECPPATAASPAAETLAAARAASPVFRGCGTAGLLSGQVATSLRVIGPAGEWGPVAGADAVSCAWAERLARALAPLNDRAAGGVGGAAGEGAGAAAAGAPPESCRLLDALRLSRVTPGALRERWQGGAGLPLVLGASGGGPLSLDLAGRPGPLLIEGGPRSGRTELLSALAASLATAHGPRDLSLVLVEGAGEGLRPVAELPHVASYVGATDPVRLRAFAQALREELKWRAAALGEAEFEGGRARAARLCPPRQAPEGQAGGAPGGAEGAGGKAPAGGAPSMLAPGSDPLPWLVVLVDDLDALLDPPLGAPGRQAAGSVLRALDAVAAEGRRLGVRLLAAGAPSAARPPSFDPGAVIRVALGGGPAGRGELRLPGEGRAAPFQGGRVTGRIPRTATQRPTVTPVDWARAGDPPARRQIRELGNGPTDIALLASAAARAAETERATAATLV
ncbi:FHA domain-containing protein [Streptomyces hoynatensis]|uniref:FHA domain-containing protein n=1 Tax=Streptomyces hoynatensis TaxID=1141874 RepID=A0A3A9YXD2_9ACTN|nr:FHA domain-containing protein [Streptomyces hoynatensis]RKN39866.1 FHA domain-containing protein [Streptomyces hoynatensis]